MDPPTDSPPFPLVPASIIPKYTTSRSRILLFDYDGTLTPIVPSPPLAILSPPTQDHLTILANNPSNEVWVISGRSCDFLFQQVGNLSPRLGLCAEHGAFIRYPGSSDWVDLGTEEDMSWRPVVAGVFEGLEREMEGSEVEVKQAALVWHYRRAVDRRYAAVRAGEVAEELKEGVGRKWKVEVVEGKCVVEVRAKALGKGGVVGRLLEDPKRGCDFLACWGDDKTDEDMFQALAVSHLAQERVFSVKVGDGSTETSAKWIVADPAEVLGCMKWLTDADDAAGHCSPIFGGERE